MRVGISWEQENGRIFQVGLSCKDGLGRTISVKGNNKGVYIIMVVVGVWSE